MVNLRDLYNDQAAEAPGASAIVYTTGDHAPITLTWGDVIHRADELAKDYIDLGAGSGRRWAVELADHPDVIPALLGLWSCGTVTVLVDPEWGASVRQSVLDHSGAEAVVRVGAPDGSRDHFTISPPTERPPLPDGVAMLAYTSGSTGAPKGIPIRHDRLVDGLLAAAAAVESFRGGPPASVGSSMRLSGFGVLVLHFLWSATFGATVVVLPHLTFRTAGAYWRTVEEHGIDQAVLVPPLFELLVRTSRRPPSSCPPPLFINASGPVSEATHARFQELFDAVVLNCYGQTEASFAVTVGDTRHPGRSSASIGRPYNLRARLRAADGSIIRGTASGELEVYGPMISDGYYDNDAANAAAFVNGWLRTGDLARRDETGRYWIVGRLKDAVMKGGHTVYLTEVEEAMLALPHVVEAIAIRLDLPGGNEDIGLLVRLDGEGIDAATVARGAEERLGRERSPRRILTVDRPLPRIGQHKPDRQSARRLWDDLAGLAGGR